MMKVTNLFKKNGNEVSRSIEELKQYMLVTVPQAIQKDDGNMKTDQYLNTYRRNINNSLFAICFGATFEPSKDNSKLKMKLNRPLPTKRECALLAELLDSYIETVEVPMFGNIGIAADDDKVIPPKDAGSLHLVPEIDKINKKVVCNDIIGWNNGGLQTASLDGTDVMYLAALGEDLRKKENRKKTMIVIGGVVVGVAIAGTIIFFASKGKSNDSVDDDVDADDLVDIDADDIDVPVVDMDVPDVDMAADLI